MSSSRPCGFPNVTADPEGMTELCCIWREVRRVDGVSHGEQAGAIRCNPDGKFCPQLSWPQRFN
jgi:hypothetical protein